MTIIKFMLCSRNKKHASQLQLLKDENVIVNSNTLKTQTLYNFEYLKTKKRVILYILTHYKEQKQFSHKLNYKIWHTH